MNRRVWIAILLGGFFLFQLVRSVKEARRPDYESHITGDDAARAGIHLVEDGKYEEALEALEFAARKPLLSVPLADVLAAMGESYHRLGKNAAGESLEHMALVHTGIAHKLRGEFEQADAAFAKAIEMKPDYAQAYESQGSLSFQLGRYDEAVRQLERAMLLDSKRPVTRSNLALTYAALGRYDSAELQISAAESLGYPNAEKARLHIANLRARSAETTP